MVLNGGEYLALLWRKGGEGAPEAGGGGKKDLYHPSFLFRPGTNEHQARSDRGTLPDRSDDDGGDDAAALKRRLCFNKGGEKERG